MKSTIIPQLFLWAFSLLLLISCERRPLEEECTNSALIPVAIDWSQSGIPVSSPTGEDYVHRVSIRFFPEDGSQAFDRYLELNVSKGEIDVPVGRYSVVVLNESVADTYWSNALYFTDIHDYSKFAANIQSDDPSKFSFYTPIKGEKFVVEPLKLASWSLDNFEVTTEMVKATHFGKPIESLTQASQEMFYALTHIVMRRLTYKVDVVADVKSLRSAQLIQGVIRGFANKVYMATAKTVQEPFSHLLLLNNRKWNDETQNDGTAQNSFLSFGRLPEATKYWLHLDVLLSNGELHKPTVPLLFDVTDQVNTVTDPDIHVKVQLQLPYSEGGINIGDWNDEEHVLN